MGDERPVLPQHRGSPEASQPAVQGVLWLPPAQTAVPQLPECSTHPVPRAQARQGLQLPRALHPQPDPYVTTNFKIAVLVRLGLPSNELYLSSQESLLYYYH